uniref:Uncharacterized protein n=1 Tax=Marseillevirus LCMAC103 TaxID=2506604 RepID=A0A481YUQ2_9VIRU|nr:MAG: hypothetical protein LCMAC103_02460 [Marseillevirus LCMAC103]
MIEIETFPLRAPLGGHLEKMVVGSVAATSLVALALALKTSFCSARHVQAFAAQTAATCLALFFDPAWNERRVWRAAVVLAGMGLADLGSTVDSAAQMWAARRGLSSAEGSQKGLAPPGSWYSAAWAASTATLLVPVARPYVAALVALTTVCAASVCFRSRTPWGLQASVGALLVARFAVHAGFSLAFYGGVLCAFLLRHDVNKYVLWTGFSAAHAFLST